MFERSIRPSIDFEKATYVTVADLIAAELRKDINQIQSLYECFNITQQSASLDHFAEDLEKKLEECSFCEKCSPVILSALFVIGLSDARTRQHVLHELDDKLTLGAALKIAREYQNSARIERTISAARPPDERVDALTGRERPPKNARTGRCPKGCRSHPRGICKASQVTCFKCQRRGHFASACRVKIDDLQEEDPSEMEPSVDELSVWTLQHPDGLTLRNDCSQQWWQRIKFARTTIDMKMDSGDQASILPFRLYRKLIS